MSSNGIVYDREFHLLFCFKKENNNEDFNFNYEEKDLVRKSPKSKKIWRIVFKDKITKIERNSEQCFQGLSMYSKLLKMLDERCDRQSNGSRNTRARIFLLADLFLDRHSSTYSIMVDKNDYRLMYYFLALGACIMEFAHMRGYCGQRHPFNVYSIILCC